MTDLQMSLIAASGVFVLVVFVFNKWQEHKAKKSVERAFGADHDDVLMRTDGGGAEPRLEPSLESEAESQAPRGMPPSSTPAEIAENLVDPLIDCLIPLKLEAPLRGDKALPILRKLRHVGNKPIHYVGLAVSGDWEPIVHGGVYTELQAGVQLASRTTALNELEYSELVTRIRSVCDELQAEPQVPDMIEVMGEARNLHRFVAGHDAQLGVNLASNGAPWAIGTLIGVLEKDGFDVRPDGRYVKPDGDGGTLYALSTNETMAAETTSRLTLLLDVPCVAPARDGFGQMMAAARDLAQRLDASIVDDSNQPLGEASLQEIAGQVQAFYQEMEQADIPAGSARALRLFS